ncbi:MAG: hypothetical protein Q7T74_02150 [Candidatus Saccharibacteria bacterium]|nr:hypothetical protein [Candidatus Saccharibacteria bacterium]
MYKRWAPKKDRFSARNTIRWLKKAKTWQLVLLLILVGFIAATLLRLNNIGMVNQRKEVLAADKKLDNTNTKKQLTQLQNYVSSHMNSDMGKGILLQNTYQRDYDQAIANAANAHNTNSDLYQKAAIDCRARFQGGTASFRNDYVQCVANAVSELPANQQSANLPKLENYHYNFASPLISPDFAGLSVLIGLILTLFILLRLILLYTLRFIVKRRAKVL